MTWNKNERKNVKAHERLLKCGWQQKDAHQKIDCPFLGGYKRGEASVDVGNPGCQREVRSGSTWLMNSRPSSSVIIGVKECRIKPSAFRASWFPFCFLFLHGRGEKSWKFAFLVRPSQLLFCALRKPGSGKQTWHSPHWPCKRDEPAVHITWRNVSTLKYQHRKTEIQKWCSLCDSWDKAENRRKKFSWMKLKEIHFWRYWENFSCEQVKSWTSLFPRNPTVFNHWKNRTVGDEKPGKFGVRTPGLST